MLLTPVAERLKGCRVVLASASPRRRDILGYTRLPFEVVTPAGPEALDKAAFAAPQDYAVETAREKALGAGQELRGRRGAGLRRILALWKPLLVIAADTIVALDGMILEKPKDEDDAVWMLHRLSGRRHSVFTGVAVALYAGSRDPEPEVRTFWEETRVTFSVLSDAVVRDYVATGEPMDKAGGYGIQGLGAMLVERVDGDVLNVTGFPLNRFCRELAAMFREPAAEATPDPGAAGGAVGGKGDPASPGGDDVTAAAGGGDADAASPKSPPGAVGGASGAGPAPPAPPRTVNAWYVTPTGFPGGLLEVIDGFKDSQVLFAACRLGLFDLLSDTEPRGVAEVAARVGGAEAEEEAESGAGPWPAWVGSLMEACVGLGLLQWADGGYLTAPAARRHLRADSARPLRAYVRSLDRGGWEDVRALGRGPPGQSPRSPGSQADADAAELELEALMADEALATFDLGHYRAIAQVGGGTLALQLARATPRAHVTPVGDPARDPLPPADLYVLAGLDWAERDLDDLLRRVAAALAPGGAVLLTEGPTHRQPLSLLGSTFDPPTPPGGRGPRWSDPAHRARLRRLGFRDVRVTSPPGRLPPAVLAARGDP